MNWKETDKLLDYLRRIANSLENIEKELKKEETKDEKERT